jgi:hypothetical protein
MHFNAVLKALISILKPKLSTTAFQQLVRVQVPFDPLNTVTLPSFCDHTNTDRQHGTAGRFKLENDVDWQGRNHSHTVNGYEGTYKLGGRACHNREARLECSGKVLWVNIGEDTTNPHGWHDICRQRRRLRILM